MDTSKRTRRRRPRLPPLTFDIVQDEEALERATDEVLLAVPELRRLSARIRRAQEALRSVVDDDGFEAYLRLEQTVNARFSEAVMIVVRWAFAAGRRSRR